MIEYTLLDVFTPDWLRKKGLKRQGTPRQGVLHITGRTTYLRAESRRLSPLKYLGYNNMLRPGNSFSHYAIDPWGTIAVFAPEYIRPWSQGWSKYNGKDTLMERILSGELVLPDWWKAAWVGHKGLEKDAVVRNLDDLIFSDASGPNERTFSVEFIQYGNQYLLTEAQYRSGYTLCLEVCTRNGIPLAPPFVLGHEDVDPFPYPPGRGGKGGGWDPGARRKKPRFCWTCMFTNDFYHSDPQGGNDKRLCKCVLPTPEQPEWAKV